MNTTPRRVFSGWGLISADCGRTEESETVSVSSVESYVVAELLTPVRSPRKSYELVSVTFFQLIKVRPKLL